MRLKRLLFALAAGLALVIAGAGVAASAIVESSEEATLDKMWFDGRFFWFAYTRERACPGDDVNTDVRLKPATKQVDGRFIVTDLKLTLKPVGKTVACPNPSPHQVQGRLDLYVLADEEVKRLEDSGYLVDKYYRLQMPEIHYYLNNPPALTPDQGKNPPTFDGTAGGAQGGAGNQTPTTSPGMVTVVHREWQAAWECQLWKNDGSRKDGFYGAGFDLDDARRDAAKECKSTNNPFCDEWAWHPDHTTCELKSQVQEVEEQYPVGQVPVFKEQVPYAEWTCELRKNDGSRKDGFSGSGATEDEARRDSTGGCRRTNNPYCDQWSRDPDHTKCNAEIKFKEP